ncbi:haemagglutination activity domain protein [Stanieria sp. NIES-3757]|nr:haemagglutination activity domain protein [Stanieria sp. NIES-3757]
MANCYSTLLSDKSNIDGLISANGSANLFLINPAGIIFGSNASLNIGGSFLGSTADSIVFPEGELSAKDTQASPLLTINAPIGLRFREESGTITVQSSEFGLEVLPEQTLALIGGDIFIEGGVLFTEGGQIELGSVAGNNLVNLTQTEQSFTISYEGIENFQDISLSQAAYLDTSGERGGEINFQGRLVILTDESQVLSTTFGEEIGGNVRVTASDSVVLSGGAELLTATEGDGVAGNIIINTKSLTLTDEALLSSDVCFELGNCGAGTGGDVTIIVSESVELSGNGLLSTTTEADGNAGNLNIQTPKLTVQDALIQSTPSIEGEGRGGDVTIETEQLIVEGIENPSEVSTTTFGTGDTGNLTIKASESIELIGDARLFAQADIDSTGNAGDLTIETKQLIVQNGAQISTNTFGIGDAGNLNINASDSILLSGTLPETEPDAFDSSAILVSAEAGSTGNGGELIINTGTLTVEKKAKISADTFGTGKGANVTLNVDRLVIQDEARVSAGSLIGQDGVDNQRGAGGTLTINADNSINVTNKSSLFTLAEGTGSAGDLTITTNKLTVADGGEINASAIGTGSAGDLKITANNVNLKQGTITATTAADTGGNIELDIAKNLIMRDNSQISAKATGEADGGNVTINSDFIVAFPNQNNDILASAEAGNGGNINITANSVLGLAERTQNPFTNDIDASSQFSLDGNVIINTPDADILQETAETPENLVDPDELVAGVCNSADTASNILEDKQNTLVIKGKGGVPPEPTKPFNSEVLVINGQATTVGTEEVTSRDTATVATQAEVDIDSIIPAQGIVRTDNGQVLLVGYATPDSTSRYPQHSRNCSI